MNKRIAVLGLSGVGKSTLIRKMRETLPLLHLQASSLIKAEQARRAQIPDNSETLRTGAVIDNQALMIAAFQREASVTDLPIVFDGHSIIDGYEGLIEIPASVFHALDLDAICFLSVDPNIIAERRKADDRRERPYRDVETLRVQQERAEVASRHIARAIERPFIRMVNGNTDIIRQLIS